MSNKMTTAEIRESWKSIKGAYIAQNYTLDITNINTTHEPVMGAAFIKVPDWVVITDDAYANRSKRVSIN